MAEALDWISGIAWTIVYAVAVYIGIQKKTYCIPSICICLNFNWELFAVLVRIWQHSSLNSGFISQLLWLVLDAGVLYTWICYGADAIQRKFSVLFLSAFCMAAITVGANLWAHAAFSINLIMSVAFLFGMDKRMYPSLFVALAKCVGTFSATILNGVLNRDYFILSIGGLCMIADLWYIFDWLACSKSNK